jgi:hypothetical protein
VIQGCLLPVCTVFTRTQDEVFFFLLNLVLKYVRLS